MKRCCKVCGKEFCVAPSQVRLRNGGQHCSRECRAVTQSILRREGGTPNWRGDEAAVQTGRGRARRLIQDLGICESCGAPAVDRHHKNGNTLDNRPENIAALCRRCHMTIDGRLDAFRATPLARRKLTDEQVRDVWRRLQQVPKPAPYGSIAALAREFGVSDSILRDIRSGRRYVAVVAAIEDAA